VTLYLDRAEALAYAAAGLSSSGELRVALESLPVCPVPYLDEPDLWDLLSLESSWETYGTPPIGGVSRTRARVPAGRRGLLSRLLRRREEDYVVELELPRAPALEDQPEALLEACGAIRGARALCSIREAEEMQEKARDRDRGRV
jgi:hypothetical protein